MCFKLSGSLLLKHLGRFMIPIVIFSSWTFQKFLPLSLVLFLFQVENEILRVDIVTYNISTPSSLTDIINVGSLLWNGGNGSETSCSDDEVLDDKRTINSYFFAFNKGLLFLNDETLQKAGISFTTVVIDGNSDKCVSPYAPVRTLLSLSSTVHDHMVMNWMGGVGRRKGYLRIGGVPLLGDYRNDVTGFGDSSSDIAHYGMGNRIEPNIVDMSRTTGILSYWFHPATTLFKFSLIFTSVGIVFATNTVVTSTLMETQDRMIKFTFLLHHHINHHLSHFEIVLRHMVESSLMHLPVMIGIHLCLLEFFRDHFLALLIFGVYWLEEIFCAVSVRSNITIKIFRKVSFSLFISFNLYCFFYPFGFVYLAYSAQLLAIVLMMMIFFNHVEVNPSTTPFLSFFLHSLLPFFLVFVSSVILACVS
jgi:hypothetical protein